MTGFVNSIQSLGAVDGPGVRYVVFMQGCPLRCVYCHNPDTWLTEGGTPTDADELVRRALRFRPYWKNGGGVTVTGGEPLLQADFVAEFFEKLHEHGVHTALDTSGVGNLAQAEKVLEHTDLVLCDLKFLSKSRLPQKLPRRLRTDRALFAADRDEGRTAVDSACGRARSHRLARPSPPRQGEGRKRSELRKSSNFCLSTSCA